MRGFFLFFFKVPINSSAHERILASWWGREVFPSTGSHATGFVRAKSSMSELRINESDDQGLCGIFLCVRDLFHCLVIHDPSTG